MFGVIQGFGIIAIVIAVGFFAAKFKIGGETAQYVLNRFAFFIGAPALMFSILAKADPSIVLGLPFLFAIVSALAVAVIFIICNKLFFHLKGAEASVGLLCGAYLNSNNIGLPVAKYVLSDPSLVAPVLLFQLVVFSPIILMVMDSQVRTEKLRASGHTEHQTGDRRRALLEVAKGPFRNPMIITAALGLLVAVMDWEVPAIILEPITMIGETAVPTILIAYGMSLYGMKLLEKGSDRRVTVGVTIIKMIIMPIVAYFVIRYGFNITGTLLYSYVVIAALPAGQNVYNYASRFNKGTVLARDTVFITTIIAPFIIAGIAWFLG